jgi:hypothetical protein
MTSGVGVREEMATNPKPTHDPLADCERAERRSSLRICNPFPALVRGVTASGEGFASRTVIDNLSASGLYLRLAQHVKPGEQLSIVIWLSDDPNDELTAPRVMVRGKVLRVESQPGGAYGLAVAFVRRRLF